MAFYVVTGKLGNGKSLVSVERIREALVRGVPVATNIDLRLHELVGRKAKKTRVMRVPDKPTLEDFEAIGIGNKSYDESKNGLLVLDELAMWFNARTWNDKTRQPVINWLLHSRKKGWDVIFIVQDEKMLDKQARESLAEHLVVCKRMDRLKIPFITFLVETFSAGLIKLRFPRVHLGIVRYGDANSSMIVDHWWVFFKDLLYRSYDTKQVFSDYYEHATYSVLPPYYTHYRYRVPYTLRNLMRLTKIHFKRYSRPVCFMAGAAITYGLTTIFAPEQAATPDTTTVVDASVSSTPQLEELLEGFTIKSYMHLPNTEPFFEVANKGEMLSSHELRAMGFEITNATRCRIDIVSGSQSKSVYC